MSAPRGTILQRAMKVRFRVNATVTDETLEASLAWLEDRISLGQLVRAWPGAKSGGNVLYRVAVNLREAHRRGMLEIRSARKPKP